MISIKEPSISRFDREHTYLFVDGGYLQQRAEYYAAAFGFSPPRIIYTKVGAKSVKCFYYDAYPEPLHDEEKDAYEERLANAEYRFRNIAQNGGWHVNFGLTKGTAKRLRQKGVDVKLALDALTHVLRGNCTKVILLTGDLDFLPLAKSLVEAGAWVEIWCDFANSSQDLRNAADGVTRLGAREVCELIHPFDVLPNWVVQDPGYDSYEARWVGKDRYFSVTIFRSENQEFAKREGPFETHYMDGDGLPPGALLVLLKSEFPEACWSDVSTTTRFPDQ